MQPGTGVLLLLLGVALYLLPIILAYIREHRNLAAIVVVNLLLGWTVVGWVLCLAWSVIAKEDRPASR